MHGILWNIFDFLKSIGELLVNFVTGIFNLGRTGADTLNIIALWNAYVPSTVSYYIGIGIVLTIVLLIINRANK